MSWYSEDNREVPYEALNGDDDPFADGEAVEFDCFPFESTIYSLRMNGRISVIYEYIYIFASFCRCRMHSKTVFQSTWNAVLLFISTVLRYRLFFIRSAGA